MGTVGLPGDFRERQCLPRDYDYSYAGTADDPGLGDCGPCAHPDPRTSPPFGHCAEVHSRLGDLHGSGFCRGKSSAPSVLICKETRGGGRLIVSSFILFRHNGRLPDN